MADSLKELERKLRADIEGELYFDRFWDLNDKQAP